MTKILCTLLLSLIISRGWGSESLNPHVDQWLLRQSNLVSWSAICVQTRSFTTLTHPLVSTGQVYFAVPGKFRWELGNPPLTVAIRSDQDMLILYPKLMRAERYHFGPQNNSPWQEALSLLEAGFPKNRESLLKAFDISAQTVGPKHCTLVLKPRSTGARKLVGQVSIVFSVETFDLISTELTFADGSTMRNEFSDQRLNAALDPGLFRTVLPSGYKESIPAKR